MGGRECAVSAEVYQGLNLSDTTLILAFSLTGRRNVPHPPPKQGEGWGEGDSEDGIRSGALCRFDWLTAKRA